MDLSQITPQEFVFALVKYKLVLIHIPQLHIFLLDDKLHLYCLPLSHRHTVKAAQTHRRVIARKLYIELGDFFAVHISCVLYIEGNDAPAAVLLHLQARVLECGVAESVAERIERFTFIIHICTSVADVIVKHIRKLEDVLHPGLGRTAP